MLFQYYSPISTSPFTIISIEEKLLAPCFTSHRESLQMLHLCLQCPWNFYEKTVTIGPKTTSTSNQLPIPPLSKHRNKEGNFYHFSQQVSYFHLTGIRETETKCYLNVNLFQVYPACGLLQHKERKMKHITSLVLYVLQCYRLLQR